MKRLCWTQKAPGTWKVFNSIFFKPLDSKLSQSGRVGLYYKSMSYSGFSLDPICDDASFLYRKPSTRLIEIDYTFQYFPPVRLNRDYFQRTKFPVRLFTKRSIFLHINIELFFYYPPPPPPTHTHTNTQAHTHTLSSVSPSQQNSKSQFLNDGIQ